MIFYKVSPKTMGGRACVDVVHITKDFLSVISCDRYKSNNTYLLLLEITSNLRKYQRREFVPKSRSYIASPDLSCQFQHYNEKSLFWSIFLFPTMISRNGIKTQRNLLGPPVSWDNSSNTGLRIFVPRRVSYFCFAVDRFPKIRWDFIVPIKTSPNSSLQQCAYGHS